MSDVTRPRRARILALLMSALLGASVLAACGDDDDDKNGGNGGDRLSKQELVSQADEICKKGDQEIETEAEEAFRGASEGNEPDPGKIQAFFKDQSLPNIEQQVNDVAALRPPEDLQAEWDAFIASARAGLTKFQQIVDDPEQLQTALEDDAQDPFKDTEDKAKALGLKECAAD
jgi:hypothetical protein